MGSQRERKYAIALPLQSLYCLKWKKLICPMFFLHYVGVSGGYTSMYSWKKRERELMLDFCRLFHSLIFQQHDDYVHVLGCLRFSHTDVGSVVLEKPQLSHCPSMLFTFTCLQKVSFNQSIACHSSQNDVQTLKILFLAPSSVELRLTDLQIGILSNIIVFIHRKSEIKINHLAKLISEFPNIQLQKYLKHTHF